MSYKAALIVLAALCLGPAPASCGPVFEITNGTLTVTGFFSNDSSLLDVRGAATFDVSDAGLPLGPLIILDRTQGTDPGGYDLPWGNTTLFAIDSDSPISYVTATLTFDFDAADAIGDMVRVPAFASTSPPGGAAGRALTLLVNGSPLSFWFNLSDSVDLGDGNLAYQWELASIETTDVPEPSQSIGVAIALLGAALVAGPFGATGRGGDA